MKKNLSMPVIFFTLLFPVLCLANSIYYPAGFEELLSRHELKNQELKDELFVILSSNHTRLSNGNDLLGCDQKKGSCFSHSAVGYSMARKYLYTQLHVQKDSRGSFLREVYCNREQKTPINESSINCEHTWPQSKFTKSFSNELQKSDMHHLYPSDITANSTRGNSEFAEVETNLNLKNCSPSKSGASVTSGGNNYFEPPMEHKGNVARAIFYFSVRYKMAISNQQQAFLRKWNEQDPVDDAEMARNDAIEKLQGDRNPFIDFPNLAQDISKF
jgi:hypothetical protein